MKEPTIPTLPEPALVGPVVFTDIPIAPGIPEASNRSFSPKKLWQRCHGASPFASNVVLTVGANAGIAMAGFVTGPLLARLLGPAGRGDLAAIQNLYWFVATLAMLGLPEATLYFTAQRKTEASRILASATVFVLLVSPLFYLAVRPLVPILLAAQSPELIRTASWYLLGIPLYALWTVPLFALRGSNDFVRWNVLRVVPAPLWLLLILGLIKFHPTSEVVAIGYLFVLAVTLIPTSLIVRKHIPGKFVPEPRRWPEMLKYGVPLAAAAIPFTLNVRVDQMIMAAFLPARSLGIYVVAVSWSGAVPLVLLAIGAVLFPRIARAEEGMRTRLLTQATRQSMFIALLLAGVFAALTPIAIPLLFGKPFAGSVRVGVVLVFAAAVLGMNIVFEEGLRGLGYTALVLWAELTGLVVTIASIAALLRPLGIMGAGIASVLGYSTTCIVLLLGICRKTHSTLADVLLLNRSDLTTARLRFASVYSLLH